MSIQGNDLLDSILSGITRYTPPDKKPENINETFEELRSLPENTKIKNVDPVIMPTALTKQHLIELEATPFRVMYAKRLEEGLFPTLASREDNEVIVFGWGMDEKAAEEVLMERHQREHPSKVAMRAPNHYDLDKKIDEVTSELAAAKTPEEEFELRKQKIILTIEESADNARLIAVLKNFAEMVDYDLALCRPILDREPHFYTRMEEIDLNEAIVARKTIGLLDQIKDAQVMTTKYLLDIKVTQLESLTATSKLYDAIIKLTEILKKS